VALRLFIVHGSHPCNTAMKALEVKGLSYKVVELPPGRLEGRPAADLALRLFPHVAGTTPAGVLSPA
jgi:hypothetical protein